MLPIGIFIGRAVGKGGGGGWTPASISSKLLYWGKISEISGGQMPNKVGTDYITVGGSAGSYTFQVPNTAAYKAADTDYIWFKTDETQRTTTEAELVGYDLPRTPVKYDSTTPYAIREILILKAGETLTTAEENEVRDKMWLSVWWSGVLSSHGQLKGNRGPSQSIWVPETVVDVDAAALISRMISVGDNPSASQQTAIETCIVSLKTADLFKNQWDVLVITRGYGAAATKLNWIKDEANALAVGTPSRADNVGYGSNGNSALNTQFPTNGRVLYTLNDASWVFKVTGTLSAAGGGSQHGSKGDFKEINIFPFNTGYHRINAGAHTGAGGGYKLGWNAIIRAASTGHSIINGSTKTDYTVSSAGFPTQPVHMMAYNNGGTVGTYTNDAEKLEVYAFGKAINEAKFAEFISIIDTYLNSL